MRYYCIKIKSLICELISKKTNQFEIILTNFNWIKQKKYKEIIFRWSEIKDCIFLRFSRNLFYFHMEYKVSQYQFFEVFVWKSDTIMNMWLNRKKDLLIYILFSFLVIVRKGFSFDVWFLWNLWSVLLFQKWITASRDPTELPKLSQLWRLLYCTVEQGCQ